MPIVRRRQKRRRESFGKFHELALLKGHDYFDVFNDDDDRRDAWEQLRDDLLTEFVVKFPGYRPWAWWVYESPERRRCVNGVHPFDSPARRAHVEKIAAKLSPEEAQSYREAATKLYYGRPGSFMVPDDWQAEYETQFAYLRRLNLLADGEAERCVDEPDTEAADTIAPHLISARGESAPLSVEACMTDDAEGEGEL